jgi:hypothetical protein
VEVGRIRAVLVVLPIIAGASPKGEFDTPGVPLIEARAVTFREIAFFGSIVFL